MNLLITDDSKRMRTLLRSMFESMFAEIYECSDGYDSIEMYEQKKPEWVFMDIKMKGMNGMQATKAILHLDPFAKIIIVSQHIDSEIKLAALHAGAVAFVGKENLEDLEQIIKGTT